jgi:hypothetical protein
MSLGGHPPLADLGSGCAPAAFFPLPTGSLPAHLEQVPFKGTQQDFTVWPPLLLFCFHLVDSSHTIS